MDSALGTCTWQNLRAGPGRGRGKASGMLRSCSATWAGVVHGGWEGP